MLSKKITKSNALINSSYRLSLNELRLVLFGLSHIDPRSDDFPMFHRVKIKELAEFYNIGEKDRGSFYDNVKDTLLNKFWGREFSYYDEELGETVRRCWLAEIRYGRKDGTLAYHYNPLIKKELQQLAKRFTSYFLTNVANMKSAYAIRIYEICIMYLNASQKESMVFNKSIVDLKNHLDITAKYKQFFNFKARVLEKARLEINKHSDIRLSYEIIKSGRSPEEIRFTITRKISKNKVGQPLLEQSSNKTILSTRVLEKAKKIAFEARTGWDIYEIERQFHEYSRKKGRPDNPDGAFIAFVKKKVAVRIN